MHDFPESASKNVKATISS